MAGLLQLVFFTIIGCSRALDNGLARTPPMGFNSWERFGCNTHCDIDPDNCISENLYKKMADIIAEEGYKDVGYEYIGIDDCWLSRSRDGKGNLRADPKRFPNGILGLSRYVHSKGLKLGIYEDVGTMTCAKYPGCEGHIEQDAQTFADWEVDLLKFDGCNTNATRSAKNFPLMSHSLNKTGRPILFTCEWWSGNASLQSHYLRNSKYCNSWRTGHDSQPTWNYILDVLKFYRLDVGNFSAVSAPGSINDPDMLVIGNHALSYDQEKAQFGMWAMFSGSLFISTDLRNIRPEAKSILLNKGVIAIDQDPLVKGGTFLQMIGRVQVWIKHVVPVGSLAVAFVNPSVNSIPARLSVPLSNLTLSNPKGYNVTDVFDDVNKGLFKPATQLNITVNPTGIVLLKAVPLG